MSIEKIFLNIARLPLRLRRILLWLLLEVATRFGWMPKSDISSIFSEILNLPGREASSEAKNFEYNDALSLLEWATFNFRTEPQFIRDTYKAVIFNEEPLRRLGQDENRSIIFAPLHMGAYVLGMTNLIHRNFRGRRVLIVRNHDQNENDTGVLKRVKEMGCELRFMNIKDKASYVDCLRFARSRCIVICFVDLPETYGTAVDVELFRRPARLAMGIDTLARAINAPIVPLGIKSYMTRDEIRVGQPFEVGPPSEAERDRVTALITDHVQRTILETPSQWHMWPRISEYLVEPELPIAESRVSHA